MKWTYSIKNKIAASIALLALCLVVLLSNYLGRQHTGYVKNYISTMYEDRLLAETYIVQLNSDLYQLKEMLNTRPADAEQKIALLFDVRRQTNLD